MIAVIRAIPGHEDQLVAAIATLTAAVRREPGCLEFRPFRDVADPRVFYLSRSTPTPTRSKRT